MKKAVKIYVLMVSQEFPSYHKKKGLPTNFPQKINALTKLHTIRSNYPLWKKRFEKIDKGEAQLSVRVWTGTPYKSQQEEVFRFTKADGIGIEKLTFCQPAYNMGLPVINDQLHVFNEKNERVIELIADNDGLSYEDFKEWFKNADWSEDFAIIHFTRFRYNKS